MPRQVLADFDDSFALLVNARVRILPREGQGDSSGTVTIRNHKQEIAVTIDEAKKVCRAAINDRKDRYLSITHRVYGVPGLEREDWQVYSHSLEGTQGLGETLEEAVANFLDALKLADGQEAFEEWVEARTTVKRVKVWLRSVPGPYEQYDGSVEVYIDGNATESEIFHKAVRELQRGSFRERPHSMWHMERWEGVK